MNTLYLLANPYFVCLIRDDMNHFGGGLVSHLSEDEDDADKCKRKTIAPTSYSGRLFAFKNDF